MNRLLTDIELDIQELKCVLNAMAQDANPVLRNVAKRNVFQMRDHLDELLSELDRSSVRPLAQEVLAPAPKQEVEKEPVIKGNDESLKLLVEKQTAEPLPNHQVAFEPVKEDCPTKEEVAPLPGKIVLGDKIKTGADLKGALSLNDSFRFSRELFDHDNSRMNRVLQQTGEMRSFDAAMAFLNEELKVADDNPSFLDLKEYVRKFF